MGCAVVQAGVNGNWFVLCVDIQNRSIGADGVIHRIRLG